jgi:fructokinase
MNPSVRPTVVCFGEILWDFLPDGLYPGGAPFNVATHLQRQGVQAHLVSAIGRDLLGDELVRRLRHEGLDVSGLTRHQGLPTGYVRASLGAGGDAHYEITPSVAWDQITPGEDSIRAAYGARAVVYGSLALRSTYNRAALDRLLAIVSARPERSAAPEPLRVFDVNLRPPHDDLAVVRELARRSTLLKLNQAEAARLADGDAGFGHEEGHARAIAAASGCGFVCITAGPHGAGLLRDGQWTWETGRAVEVVDTIGSGDAFLATLVAGLVLGENDPSRLLARACRHGEWVATRRGAIGAYDATTPR